MQIICTEAAGKLDPKDEHLYRSSCSSLLKPTVLTVLLENRVPDDSDANELGHP